MNDKDVTSRYAELQQQWHGWGSPVGIGIAMLCAGLSVAVMLAALSLF